MSKKYQNINDPGEEKVTKRKRFTLNPFENLYTKDGRGVEKDEPSVLEKPGLANFFKLLRRRLNHVFSVNLLLVFGNFPIFFGMFALAYTTRSASAPDSQMFSALQAAARFDPSPVVTSLLGVYGGFDTVSVLSTLSYVMFALTALVLVTFGPVSCGTAYVYRNMVRGEPVFIWSDFWYAIKKNWRQALIFGIIDVLIMAMLVYDIFAYRINTGASSLYLFMFVLSMGLSVIYFFVRMYVYPMMVTFDLSIFKLIKNGVFFAVLGIKRNIMVLLGTLAVVLLDLWLMSIFLPLGLILPFVIMFGLLGYMAMYGAYPKIKEVMIDPYYKEIEEKSDGE